MNKKIIDLTHTLSNKIPAWDGKADLELSVATDYKDCVPPDLFRIQRINMSLSLGTHMDAPAHVIPNARTIDQLIPTELVVNCIVIDVSDKSHENYLVSTEVIEEFEKEHGKITEGSLVIFYTGWSKRWNNPDKYHNNHNFPALDSSVVQLLIQRNVAGVGIDTFSCDTGKNGFPVHRTILGADKYLIENIANADMLPATGATVFVMPTKIEGGTEASIRLMALI